MIDSGVVLLKYWLEVGSDKQKERLASRVSEPIKYWKLSSIDLAARERWYAYSRARDQMFGATDTERSPWYIVQADDKREARINCISHMLQSIPYEPSETPHVEIPARDKQDAYDDVASLAGRKFFGFREELGGDTLNAVGVSFTVSSHRLHCYLEGIAHFPARHCIFKTRNDVAVAVQVDQWITFARCLQLFTLVVDQRVVKRNDFPVFDGHSFLNYSQVQRVRVRWHSP